MVLKFQGKVKTGRATFGERGLPRFFLAEVATKRRKP